MSRKQNVEYTCLRNRKTHFWDNYSYLVTPRKQWDRKVNSGCWWYLRRQSTLGKSWGRGREKTDRPSSGWWLQLSSYSKGYISWASKPDVFCLAHPVFIYCLAGFNWHLIIRSSHKKLALAWKKEMEDFWTKWPPNSTWQYKAKTC